MDRLVLKDLILRLPDQTIPDQKVLYFLACKIFKIRIITFGYFLWNVFWKEETDSCQEWVPSFFIIIPLKREKSMQ